MTLCRVPCTLLFLVASVSEAVATAQVDSSCRDRVWSAPHLLGTPPAPWRTLRFPSLATRGGELYVAGMDIARFTDSLRGPLLVVWSSGHGNLGRPAGDFRFVFPKVFVDHHDVLHLFWAESANGPASQWTRWPLRTQSLWWATYDRRRGWSMPQRIYDGQMMFWPADPAAISMDTLTRTLNVIVPARTPPAAMSLLRLRYSNGTWQSDTIAGTRGAVSVSMPNLHGREVTVGYIAGMISADRNGANSVFIVSSTDGGATWNPPRLLHSAQGHPAQGIDVFHDGSHVVHIVWGENRSNDIGIDALRHMSSADFGTTWSGATDVALPHNVTAFAAATDDCGGLHAVYENWGADGRAPGRLGYVRWDGSWSEPQDLVPELVAQNPALLADSAGLRLVFVARPRSAPENAQFSTWSSSLSRP